MSQPDMSRYSAELIAAELAKLDELENPADA